MSISKEQKEYFSNKLVFSNFIFAVLVICIHQPTIEKYNLPATGFMNNFAVFFQDFFIYNFALVAVPSFLAISGFLFYLNYDFSKTSVKYKSRFKSIVIPYLMWGTFYYIYYLIISQIPQLASFTNCVADFSLSTFLEAVFLHKFGVFLWFLEQLIIYTVLCPLIYALFKNKYTAVCSLCVVLLINAFQGKIPEIPVINMGYFFYYLLGVFFAIHYRELIMLRASRKTAVISAVVFVAALIMYVFKDYLHIYNHIFYQRAVLLCSAWFAFDLITIPKHKHYMTYSFFMYLFHPCLVGFVKNIALLLPKTAVFSIITYIAANIITVFICIFAAKVLEKYLSPAWKLLNGNR